MKYQMEFSRTGRNMGSSTEINQPLKVTVPETCPKCDEKVWLTINRVQFHCHKCGFVQETPWEARPVTLEMINRPAPTNRRSI